MATKVEVPDDHLVDVDAILAEMDELIKEDMSEEEIGNRRFVEDLKYNLEKLKVVFEEKMKSALRMTKAEYDARQEKERKRQEEEIAKQRIKYCQPKAQQAWALKAMAPGSFSLSGAVEAVKASSSAYKEIMGLKDVFKGKKASAWKTVVSSIVPCFQAAYTAGVAINAILSLFSEPEERESHEQIVEQQLGEIINKLEDINKTIEDGFNRLIAQNDYRDFRLQVIAPTLKLGKAYFMCQRNTSQGKLEEFMDLCTADKKPWAIMSDMESFLTGPSNIFYTHLKLSDFTYDGYEEWLDIIMQISVQLSLMNTFYYGAKTYKNEIDREAEAAKEAKEAEERMKNIQGILEQLELQRLAEFHKCEKTAETLKNLFINSMNISNQATIRLNYDKAVRATLKKATMKWKGANGEHDFMLVAVRGRKKQDSDPYFVSRKAGYIIDPTRVAAVENIPLKNIDKCAKYFSDGICFFLIQPVTPESAAAHQAALDDGKWPAEIETIMKQCVSGRTAMQIKLLEDIQQSFEKKMTYKPALVSFCNNFNYQSRTMEVQRVWDVYDMPASNCSGPLVNPILFQSSNAATVQGDEITGLFIDGLKSVDISLGYIVQAIL